MVLLVEWENQVVKELTARNSGVVAEHSVKNAHTVLKLAVASDNKAHRHRLIEHL